MIVPVAREGRLSSTRVRSSRRVQCLCVQPAFILLLHWAACFWCRKVDIVTKLGIFSGIEGGPNYRIREGIVILLMWWYHLHWKCGKGSIWHVITDKWAVGMNLFACEHPRWIVKWRLQPRRFSLGPICRSSGCVLQKNLERESCYLQILNQICL